MIEAAVDLITRGGCEKATLQAIGQAAGYSRGLVSHRFGSKDGLLRAVMSWIAELWRQELDPSVAGLEGADALCAFAHAHGSFALRHPEIVRALFTLWFEALNPQSSLRPAALDEQQRVRTRVEGWLHSALARGSLPDSVDPALQSTQFCGALYGITYQWLTDPECLDLSAMLNELEASTRRSLPVVVTRQTRRRRAAP
jgi:AcrR family transcriptional regulator